MKGEELKVKGEEVRVKSEGLGVERVEEKVSVALERQILGRDFKLYGTLEEPLFLAKDVADWIGHSKVSMMLQSIDEEEKVKVNNPYFEERSGGRGTWFITEDGLYEILMQSRKPIAKAFKKEVKKILKEVRKTGIYVKDKALDYMLENPEVAIEVLKIVKSEKLRANNLAAIVTKQKPKAIFADAVTASDSTILVGSLAKLIKQNGIDIGQNRLFIWLRENGYLIKSRGSNHNMPTQKSMELGLFRIKEVAIERSNGTLEITKTPLVTGKGQLYFINKFLSSE